MTKAEGPAEHRQRQRRAQFQGKTNAAPARGLQAAAPVPGWERRLPAEPRAGGGEQRSGQPFPGAKLLTSSYLLKIDVRQENARESAAGACLHAWRRASQSAWLWWCRSSPRSCRSCAPLRPHLLPADGAAQAEDTPHLPGSTHPPASTHRHQQNSVPPRGALAGDAPPAPLGSGFRREPKPHVRGVLDADTPAEAVTGELSSQGTRVTLCVRSAQDWALPHPERHHGARALCLGLPHARTRVLVQGRRRALSPPQAADAARCCAAASRCLRTPRLQQRSASPGLRWSQPWQHDPEARAADPALLPISPPVSTRTSAHLSCVPARREPGTWL